MGSAIIVVGVAAGTLIIFGYLLFIWWLDRYEREPLWVVLLAFLWGGMGGTCLGCALSLPFAALAKTVPLGGASDALTAVLAAPFAEEFTKGLVFVPLLFTAQIDNETDGLIYGAATGLGFAAVENLLYYFGALKGGAGAVLTLVVLRTLFTALVHCVSSSILGMSIGYARHRAGASRWVKYPVMGYLVAVANHALWNATSTLAGIAGTPGSVKGLLTLAGIGLVIVAGTMMFIITQVSLAREHKLIERFLKDEAERGTLPGAHAAVIPCWRKRRQSGWLSPAIPKSEYVHAATLLAFRRHQKKIARGERSQMYQRDINAYRQQLRQLRAQAG